MLTNTEYGEDWTGRRFHHWTVLGPSTKTYPNRSTRCYKFWECECDCGNRVAVVARNLFSKRSTQCQSCAAKENRLNTQNRLNGEQLTKECQRCGEWFVVTHIAMKNCRKCGMSGLEGNGADTTTLAGRMAIVVKAWEGPYLTSAVRSVGRNCKIRFAEDETERLRNDAAVHMVRLATEYKPTQVAAFQQHLNLCVWRFVALSVRNIRRERRKASRTQPFVDYPDRTHDPADNLPCELATLVRKWIPQPRTAQIVLDYFMDEQTLQEIGDRLGITRERVRQIVENGLLHLRKHQEKILDGF